MSTSLEDQSHTAHVEKEITITHSELRLAVTKTFQTLGVTTEKDKEIYFPFIFDLLLNLKVNHYDISKILNSHV